MIADGGYQGTGLLIPHRRQLGQAALHKHLLQQSPAIWWTHIHATGDPVKLVQGLQTALAARLPTAFIQNSVGTTYQF